MQTAFQNLFDGKTRWYYFTLALIFLISLWLRAAFPIFAMGGAVHDDVLFVNLTSQLGKGHWLGAYDNLTHAKGITYSVFMLVNHLFELPLKLSEHTVYLMAALFVSALIGRVCSNKWAAVLSFAIMAFIPTAWTPGAGGRIVRENLYISLSLFVFGLSVWCFVAQSLGSVRDEIRAKKWQLVLLGLVAGAYWLTREEGVWLLPSLLILCCYWIWSRRSVLRPWMMTLVFFGLPLCSMALVVNAVNSINYLKYGVFRNNDFRSADFQAGYGAISRIKPDHWQRYVVFPKDAREWAYRVSPAARELKPFLDGPVGDSWKNIGCGQTETKPCDEILSGWLMWALRDAVAAAGHYQTAEKAQSYYLKLSAEIDAACVQQPDKCFPFRATMVPPWQSSYLTDTLRASRAVFKTLTTLYGIAPSISSSVGTAKQLAQITVITDGPLATADFAPGASIDNDLIPPRDAIRFRLADYLTSVEKTVTQFGIPASLVGWILWCVLALWRRKLDIGFVVASAMAVAVVTRVILLGFLEATSIPSNNMLYLMPVLPIALGLIPVVAFGLLGIGRNEH